MFAYCNNNSTNMEDYTGLCHGYANNPNLNSSYSGVRYGYNCGSYGVHARRPKSYFGAASSYSHSDSTDYNCYAYALGENQWKYVGGSPDAVKDFDVNNVAGMVLLDAQKDGRAMRVINSHNSLIGSNEYRIALRTGVADYHFMVQHSNGSWSHKPGFCSTRLIDGTNPSVISWDMPEVDSYLLYSSGIIKETGYIHNYYDSETIYFAVSK